MAAETHLIQMNTHTTYQHVQAYMQTNLTAFEPSDTHLTHFCFDMFIDVTMVTVAGSLDVLSRVNDLFPHTMSFLYTCAVS